MTNFTSVSEESIRDRFKQVEIKLEPWPYFLSSAKQIISGKQSANGKQIYTIEFACGQVREIAEEKLGPLKKILLPNYKVTSTEKKQATRKKVLRHDSSNSESDVERLVIPHKTKKRRLTILSDSDDNENYEPENEDVYRDIYSSDEEQEITELTVATTRGRQVTKPRSYQEDFKHLNKLPKVYRSASKSTFQIPFYTDKLFIKNHALLCFSCKRSGDVYGKEEVQIGKEERRLRLLLCHHCSISAHNNCIASTRSIDRETGRFKCSKCFISHKCAGCSKSILAPEEKRKEKAEDKAEDKADDKAEDKADDKAEDKAEDKVEDKVEDKAEEKKRKTRVAFRCSTCFRCFHRRCVVGNVSPSLADKMKTYDLDSLYQSGLCMECLTFVNRTPQSIVGERSVSEIGTEVLIKWKGESFRHTTWVLEDWISQFNSSLHRGYLKRKQTKGIPPISEEWSIIDRILDVEWEDKTKTKVKRVMAVFRDTEYIDAVWDEPPSEDETEAYTEYKNALERYLRASKVQGARGMESLIKKVRTAATSESYEKHALKEQPEFINNGTLMKHQMEALNWLIYQWEKKQSCVLADDMGLGKTIQIISFLYFLFKKFDIYPFLIVVPNSTATNWIREFEKWAPEMIVAPFFGYSAARDLALTNEIMDSQRRIRCHAVVATYESVLETSPLHSAFWPALIVDESQRLKNDESHLFKTLRSFRIDHTVLLTGTPLQNNLRELFNIMHFIHPKEFRGIEASNYEEMTAAQVEELHSRLRPHFLRRTKEEVLKKLPPKYELIVPVSMTPLQKEVYKQCISREIHETLAMTSGYKRQKGLSSIFTNLRKNLNHPYLLDGVEKPQSSPDLTQKNMIDACAKLKLFHQIFPKLKQKGHRILLFSTMTRTLDVLEDYFFHENILYTRIDGSTRERDRVRSIDAFNAPGSKLDVFLLSTRAGGVGINLTTADTVIIWDSDFNPYADLQAISRAHRIGQNKMVLIYRLMTRLTIEEKVLQIGKKKMALEHVVVERMKADEEEKLEDIESILKYGTEALFADDSSKDIVYDEAAIDNLLDREQYRKAATEQQLKEIQESEESNKESSGVNFSFAQVWQADGTVKELDANPTEEDKESDFWEKFLKEQQAAAEKKKEEKKIAEQNLGRGARKRAIIAYTEKYAEEKTNQSKSEKQSDKDEDFVYEEPMVIDIEELEEEPSQNSKANTPNFAQSASMAQGPNPAAVSSNPSLGHFSNPNMYHPPLANTSHGPADANHFGYAQQLTIQRPAFPSQPTTESSAHQQTGNQQNKQPASQASMMSEFSVSQSRHAPQPPTMSNQPNVMPVLSQESQSSGTPNQASQLPHDSNLPQPSAHTSTATASNAMTVTSSTTFNPQSTSVAAPVPIQPLPQQYKNSKYEQLYYLSRKYIQSFQKFFMEECINPGVSVERFQSVYRELFARFANEANVNFFTEAAQERMIETNYGFPTALIDHYYAQKQQIVSAAIAETIHYMEAELMNFINQYHREKLQKDLQIEEQRIHREYQDKLANLLKEQEKQRKALLEEQKKLQDKKKEQYSRLMPPAIPLPLPPTASQPASNRDTHSMQQLITHLKRAK